MINALSLKKKNSSMLCRILALLYALISCALLSACVKTPSQSNVVNKGDNQLQELISQSAVVDYTYDVPNRWEKTQSKGNLTIQMAADVETPDVTRYPVLQISPSPYTIEQIEAICQSLAPNEPLYEWHDKTKSQVESILVRAKWLLAHDKQAEDHPFGFTSDDRIAYYSDLVLTAPDTYTLKPVSMAFQSEDDISTFVGMTAPDANGRYLVVDCSNGSDNFDNYLIVTNHNSSDNYYVECQQPWSEEIPMPLSVDEAEETAEQWMQSAGIQNYSLRSISIGIKVDTALMAVYPMLQFQPNVYKELENCFILFYAPEYNEIPCNYARTSTVSEDLPESYNKLWKDEYLTVYVSKDGIEYIEWKEGIGKIDQSLNENMQLLAYSEVQEIIWNSLFNSYANFINESRQTTTLEIEKVTLSYRKVLIKDQTDDYMLIPTWDVYGRIVFDIHEGYSPNSDLLVQDENGRYVDNLYMHSLLTVSALDGSIINTVLGY